MFSFPPLFFNVIFLMSKNHVERCKSWIVCTKVSPVIGTTVMKFLEKCNGQRRGTRVYLLPEFHPQFMVP